MAKNIKSKNTTVTTPDDDNPQFLKSKTIVVLGDKLTPDDRLDPFSKIDVDSVVTEDFLTEILGKHSVVESKVESKLKSESISKATPTVATKQNSNENIDLILLNLIIERIDILLMNTINNIKK